MNKNSKFLWLYSTVLFTAAFVLILMTAASQSRLTKDIQSYKEQLNTQKGLFQGVQKNLNDLAKENEQLQQKLEVTDVEKKGLEEQVKTLKEQITQMDMQQYKIKKSMDDLIEAKKYADQKDYKESALYLSSVYFEVLSEDSKKTYNNLGSMVFTEAAAISYKEGYKLFNSNKLDKAIEEFELSLQFKKDAYFSDDAMFFLALSFYKLDRSDRAKDLFIQHDEKYPDSTYKADVRYYLEVINRKSQ
ncbi:MAG: hypothetical protein AB7G87_05360 [Clostridia bacterium]